MPSAAAPSAMAAPTSARRAASSASYLRRSTSSAICSSSRISESRSVLAASMTPRSAKARRRPGPHSPMSFTHGTIRLNSRAAELLLDRRVRGQLQALGDVEPHPLPYRLRAEAVAHQIAPLDHELLAVGPLGLGQLPVVVAQGEPPERHVPGLVLHHVSEDLL